MTEVMMMIKMASKTIHYPTNSSEPNLLNGESNNPHRIQIYMKIMMTKMPIFQMLSKNRSKIQTYSRMIHLY